MTNEQLQQIVELGKAATKRPWQWATSNSHRRLSNEQQDGKVAFGTEHNDGVDDIVISQHDMDYSEAAANSADILAQELIEKRQRLASIAAILLPMLKEHISRADAQHFALGGHGLVEWLRIREHEARELQALLEGT